MAFIAPRLIDLAIFGTLGGLWIFGLVFIVTLYRWLARYERELQTVTALPTALVESPTPVEIAPEPTADRAA